MTGAFCRRYSVFSNVPRASILEVNLGKLFKVFDTVAFVLDATKEKPNTGVPQTDDRQSPAPASFAERTVRAVRRADSARRTLQPENRRHQTNSSQHPPRRAA